jgi:hypothetical protein
MPQADRGVDRWLKPGGRIGLGADPDEGVQRDAMVHGRRKGEGGDFVRPKTLF